MHRRASDLAYAISEKPRDNIVMLKRTLTLPGRWETANAVANDIADMVRFGLPEDYWSTFPGEVRGLSVSEVSTVASEVVRPSNVVWVIVGDRAKIETGVAELGLAGIQHLDADGNPVGE